VTDTERDAPWSLYKTGLDPEWGGRQPNADWVCSRWDELWATQRHGHYETLMRVVLDARKREYELGLSDAIASMVGHDATLCDLLAAAARQTLDENGHLADGDNCTLKVLKEALAKFCARSVGHNATGNAPGTAQKG
jgi:hypothetical protein